MQEKTRQKCEFYRKSYSFFSEGGKFEAYTREEVDQIVQKYTDQFFPE